MNERGVGHPDRGRWPPLEWRQQRNVGLLAGTLWVEIIGSGIALIVLVPATPDGRMDLSQVLLWVSIAGLLGGAARALFFLKVEFGAHGDYPPQWYLDKWPLYLAKPFLGVVGGLALYLASRVGFGESFNTDDVDAVQARTLLTALAGGMFFEGAFAQLKELMPETRPRPGEQRRPTDGSPE